MDRSNAWVMPYQLAAAGTFIFLTFLQNYDYNSINWIVVIPINIFLSEIWPVYWAILHWIN